MKIDQFYLIGYLAKFKLETESARSYLGYLWWVLDPLMNAMVYFLLFSVIMKRGGPDFIYFLFLGVLTWRWMDNTISKGALAVITQATLLKKLYVSKIVLVLSEMLTILSKFLIVFFIVYLVYLFKFGFNTKHFLLPIVMICHYIFSVGAGLFMSSIVPLAPDIRFMYSHGMRLLFYPSGILFSLSRLPKNLQAYLKINPFVGLFESYRNILMYNKPVVWNSLLGLLVLGVLLGWIGVHILKKYDRQYPKFLN